MMRRVGVSPAVVADTRTRPGASPWAIGGLSGRPAMSVVLEVAVGLTVWTGWATGATIDGSDEVLVEPGEVGRAVAVPVSGTELELPV